LSFGGEPFVATLIALNAVAIKRNDVDHAGRSGVRGVAPAIIESSEITRWASRAPGTAKGKEDAAVAVSILISGLCGLKLQLTSLLVERRALTRAQSCQKWIKAHRD